MAPAPTIPRLRAAVCSRDVVTPELFARLARYTAGAALLIWWFTHGSQAYSEATPSCWAQHPQLQNATDDVPRCDMRRFSARGDPRTAMRSASGKDEAVILNIGSSPL
jgi:hypothetical protein